MDRPAKAIVLLLHGSRDPAWLEPFEEMRAEVAVRSPGLRVATACLQVCKPTLDETVGVLAGEGITDVVVVPIFISTRGHVAKDVPELVAKSRALFPSVRITLTDPVGELPGVQEAMIAGIVRAGM